MGLQINSGALASIATPQYGAVGSKRVPGQTSSQSGETRTAGAILLNQEKTEPPQAGFGQGTVSVPGAAVKTLDTNLQGARKLVPSIEETRASLRERLARQRELIEPKSGTGKTPPKPQMPKPLDLAKDQVLAGNRARRLIGALNDAAGEALKRVGVETPSPPAQPSIRIGDETTPLARQQAGPFLDVKV